MWCGVEEFKKAIEEKKKSKKKGWQREEEIKVGNTQICLTRAWGGLGTSWIRTMTCCVEVPTMYDG